MEHLELAELSDELDVTEHFAFRHELGVLLVVRKIASLLLIVLG